MSRTMAMQRSIVPAGEREKHLKRLAARRDHYRAMGCRYWVFEEAAVRGAFVEFVEADGSDPIVRAHASAADPPVDAARMYIEVELA